MARLAEAEIECRAALSIDPTYAEAHSSLGDILKNQRRMREAEDSYRKALRLKPDFAEAHHNLSHLLLATGRLGEAWPEYEYRFQATALSRLPFVDALPRWTGQAAQTGDRLLVLKEQGLGDKLQFARYLPLAAERFVDGVSMVVDRSLLTLFRRSFPNVEFLEVVADTVAWQWQCPLLSLPLAFGTTLETIPRRVPYLVPDPLRTAYWKSRIDALGLPAAQRKIGIVWKPGTGLRNAALRSLSLHQLGRLFDLPGCAWFSLQKEPDPDKAPWVTSAKMIDWADEFVDFDETAAIAAHLDLIISVDTAMAHLAGALGRPTWLLNRHASEWRWLLDRNDSPWYPTMRIFTQEPAADWDGVVARLAAEL